MSDTASQQYFVGLMSGTSVDGIDAGIFAFNKHIIRLHTCHCHDYTSEIKQRILSLATPGNNEIDRLGELDVEIAHLFAEAALAVIKKSKLAASSISAIGSHGQTIRHRPKARFPFTLQIGDPNIIAEKCGITCVGDLRRRDMAAGGQGAPLAPGFHQAAFFSPKEKRCIINIGGIANLSLLHPLPSQVLGYDTGPGNILMDAWIAKIKGTPYDTNGDWAASGKCIPELLNTLLQHPYLAQAFPKSTGREDFNLEWLESLLQTFRNEKYSAPEKPEDIQATLLEFSARSISAALSKHTIDKAFICGGGAHNLFLLRRLQELNPRIPLASTAELGVPPDWVEAGLVAWIAKQTLAGLPGNLPSATGASRSLALGAVFPR